MTDYADWIATQRIEALARNGKRWTLTMLTAAKQEADARRNGFYMADRKPGEIVNPATGEVLTDCVTIGQLAETFNTTTASLTAMMEQNGLVRRVLTWKDVRMVCNPFLRKPEYYHTPEATPAAIRAGLVVEIKGRWGLGGKGMLRSMILVTQEGQKRIRNLFLPLCEAPRKTANVRRDNIDRFHRQGLTPAEIVSMTGIPRRTVFRHLDTIRKAA